MSAATTPTLTLNTGGEIPMLGLGVFQSPPEETPAVETALGEGYRLVDTAPRMGTSARSARHPPLRADRGEIFVTTKLWISDYGYDGPSVGFEGRLRRLGLDYVDLYLLHQPVPAEFDGTIAAYKADEKVLADGRARAIGVSNFSESISRP